MPIYRVASPVFGELGTRIDVWVSAPGGSTPILLQALIDTGARVTVIRKEIADGLALPFVGFHDATTAYGVTRSRLVRAIVGFERGPSVEVEALEAPLVARDVDCLLGRDILARGLLIHDGVLGAMTLAFEEQG